ncbi:MAG: site-specific integrase [Lachnospiraceae bacterium]|nr:site-specific integrase [Lachnospiraceae bacterium]
MERKDLFITSVLQQFQTGKGRKDKKSTFRFMAEQWLSGMRLHVKESTYVKYFNVLHNHLLPELGDLSAEQLTTGTVERFIQGKLEHGRLNGSGGLSEKSVRDMLAILREICLYATHWDLEIPCHFELVRVRRKEAEIRVLTRQKQLELAQFLTSDDSLIKLGILMSLYMGLRLGEVCALQRQYILYNEGILCVRRTMQRIQRLRDEEPLPLHPHPKTKIIITEPKSNSSIRDIPIPPFLLKRLEILRDLPGDAYILTGTSLRFMEPRCLENKLQKYLKDCNLTGVTYHVLRHTFATRCVEDGFDVKSLSEILGHASVNITLNRYVHSSMDQKRRFMEQLDMLC